MVSTNGVPINYSVRYFPTNDPTNVIEKPATSSFNFKTNPGEPVFQYINLENLTEGVEYQWEIFDYTSAVDDKSDDRVAESAQTFVYASGRFIPRDKTAGTGLFGGTTPDLSGLPLAAFDLKDVKGLVLCGYDKNGDGTVQDLFGFRYGTTTYVDLRDTSYKHVNVMNNYNVISSIDNIIKLIR